MVLEQFLGSRERDVSLEVRVLQLEEAMEIADRVHTSKVDSSVCVCVYIDMCEYVCACVDISYPKEIKFILI
jgi:hypothetical protein